MWTSQQIAQRLKRKNLKKSQRRSLTDLLRRLRKEEKLLNKAEHLGTFAKSPDGIWRKISDDKEEIHFGK